VEKDYINIDGKERHVISYLQDFLFSPERARSYVRLLSGGERNRLLLARLFTRPSNMLVLDEPTNDLDVETLELLEELLLTYQGTLLLVSHDRTILNNVVTNTLVLEGDGSVREYVGGYDDWLRQRKTPEPEPIQKAAEPKKSKQRIGSVRRLTYNEKRELETLPERIETLEAEQHALYDSMADPAFYQSGGEDVVKVTTRLEALKQKLEATYKRWEELETIAS
jgi:ATP-binding cassette subfamily F protein uup